MNFQKQSQVGLGFKIKVLIGVCMLLQEVVFVET